jgi:hypothetical protein
LKDNPSILVVKLEHAGVVNLFQAILCFFGAASITSHLRSQYFFIDWQEDRISIVD